jgi:hypothetical protein
MRGELTEQDRWQRELIGRHFDVTRKAHSQAIRAGDDRRTSRAVRGDATDQAVPGHGWFGHSQQGLLQWEPHCSGSRTAGGAGGVSSAGVVDTRTYVDGDPKAIPPENASAKCWSRFVAQGK